MAGVDELKYLSCALAIGLLIGMERGWQMRESAPGTRVAGFRTFGLLGLTGGIAGILPLPVAAAVLLVAGAMLVLGYARASLSQTGQSATTALAGLLTLALGMLATTGYWLQALAAAAVTTLLLSMRERMHGWLKGMSPEEIEAVGRFALIALVILPLMPDRSLGPYDAWNPRQIWLVVVLVCALSFTGYVATRRVGATRGLLVTALSGAIVSSTAVTAAYARKLVAPSAIEGVLIAGIALATVTLFVRALVLSAILMPSVLPSLALVMVPAIIVALLLAGLALRRMGQAGASEDVKLGNPLDFGPALILAGFVAVLAVLARWARDRFGDAGMAILLAITGVADVDAAILTMAGLPRDMIDAHTAGLMLAAPVLANTTLKGLLAIGIARNRRGLRAAVPLFASVAASGLALALLA